MFLGTREVKGEREGGAQGRKARFVICLFAIISRNLDGLFFLENLIPAHFPLLNFCSYCLSFSLLLG